jgi:hypothetical protein
VVVYLPTLQLWAFFLQQLVYLVDGEWTFKREWLTEISGVD